VGWRGPDFWRKPLILLGKLVLDGREWPVSSERR